MSKLLFFAALAISSAIGVVSDFDQEVAYVSALRERGLHRLSEMQCNRLAEQSELSPAQRVQLTVETTKTLTSLALNSRQPKRDETWRRAQSLLKSQIASTQEDAWRAMLELQLGLTMLEQAAWARRESEIRAANDNDWNQTRSLIRAAINQLKSANQSFVNLKRGRVSQDANLSSNEIAELQRNTNYALSRAYRNQAIAYQQKPVDQIAALTQALKLLQPIANDGLADDLVWRSRIDRVECYRLRGDLTRASQLIAEANTKDPPPEYLGRLAAEGVRLALASKNLPSALQFVRSQNQSNQPELDLARVETLVALATQKSATEAESYRKEAAQIAARLDRQHGTYWGMRGEILIAKLSESSSQASSETTLLETTARTLLRQAQPEKAIATFLRAAEQAERNGDASKAFDYFHKAAIVHQQEDQLQSAIDRFRYAANNYPNQPGASEAHLQAAFNAAKVYQTFARAGDDTQAAKRLTAYSDLLAEHLSTWPDAPSSDQARIWFGRLLQAQGKTAEAAEIYRAVSVGSKHAAEAIEKRGTLYLKQFSSTNDALGLQESRQWFSDRLEKERADAGRVAALQLAKLAFVSPPDYKMAQAAIEKARQVDAKDESLLALRIVALAGLEETVSTARSELTQLLPLPAALLLDVLRGLQPIRDARPDDAAVKAMANDCLRLVRPFSGNLSAADQLLIQTSLADAAAHPQALATYRELAGQHRGDRRIQLRYAELVAVGRDRAAREEALKQWRSIVKSSKPRSATWFRGKLGVAQTYFDKGEHSKAKQQIQLLSTLYPAMGGAELKSRFQALLQRIEDYRFK